MTYPETSDDAYTRRAKQTRALIAELQGDLNLLESALRDSLEGEPQHRDWADVGDLATIADSLIATITTLRDCEPDELSAELLGQ